MNIAVITGASAGIGRELVYAVDKDAEYDEIWVIARRKERLEELRRMYPGIPQFHGHEH